MDRREALKTLLLGFGIGPLACAPRAGESDADAGAAAVAKSDDACWITPEETEGPFYFDPALVRQDIRAEKTGIPLRLAMTLIDTHCNPVVGASVDIWHCDKDGLYSGYNQPAGNTVGETFLRGTQTSDAKGIVRFTTVYPGWYLGRATHIHFKVRTKSATYKTSQFAFPEDMNARVYQSALYSERGRNPVSNADDGIFGEAAPRHLMVALSGDPEKGFAGTFTVGLDTAKPTRRRTRGRSTPTT